MDPGSIDAIARLARLDLDDDAKRRVQAELDAILATFRTLADVDVEGVPPLFHVGDPVGRPREDEPFDGASRDEILRNAPATRDGCYEVPRVLE